MRTPPFAKDGAADPDQQVHRQIDRRRQQRPAADPVPGGENDDRPREREPDDDLDQSAGPNQRAEDEAAGDRRNPSPSSPFDLRQ